MAQNSKDAQKRASRAERRAAEAAEMKARAEQMEKESRCFIAMRSIYCTMNPDLGCKRMHIHRRVCLR